MAGVSSRGRGRRRTINEINMVPFIDVMLVLLIIFMVSAPLITTGVVDVPSVGKAKQAPEHVVHVMIDANERLKMRRDRDEPTAVALSDLSRLVLEAQAGDAQTPVVIAADKQVRYEVVMNVMDQLQRHGVQRVGLAVRASSATR